MAIVVDRKTKLTYEDYLQLPEDGRRHEIIDGDHYVSAAPFVPHQRVVKRLMVQFYRRIEETGLGEVLPAPVATVLSETDVVEPDLVVVLGPNASVVTRERIDGAPDLVVEILSPSTAHRDRGLKLDLYQKSGVAEYWIVDAERRVVHQYVLEDGVFRASGEHAERITVACTAGCGGRPVRIDLTAIW
ncbi:MAG: Uma2 family endonuclease [Spirochaetaceae bacterium]|nr:Uma2 family endonuclease [Spirochaetaceae bacterium]